MAKGRTWYKCSNCGANFSSMRRTCTECKESNVIVLDEERTAESQGTSTVKLRDVSAKVVALADIVDTNETRIPTGISEFDRVLGGGIVHDSVITLSAPPGMGKSTLLLQVANKLALTGKTVLYVSGEESAKQIKTRSDRILGSQLSNRLLLLSTSSMDELKASALDKNADVIICDSISKMKTDNFSGSRAGTPIQMEECTDMLINLCKFGNKPRIGIMIVHVTKDDEMRGSRTIEHDVDTTLKLEGEDFDDLRILRSTKNRFGELDTGLFVMMRKGLEELTNPSEYFITQRDDNKEVKGVALSVVNEGTRPIVVEIESLIDPTMNPYPSRIASCLRKDNLNILLSIITQTLGYDMSKYNVVINTTGGLKVSEPGVNLAIIMSIVSNYLFAQNKSKLPLSKTVFIAEVGLTGELKRVQGIERRLKELDKMGYEYAYVAKRAVRDKSEYKNIKIIECADLTDVIKAIKKQ